MIYKLTARLTQMDADLHFLILPQTHTDPHKPFPLPTMAEKKLSIASRLKLSTTHVIPRNPQTFNVN